MYLLIKLNLSCLSWEQWIKKREHELIEKTRIRDRWSSETKIYLLKINW